MLGATLKTGQSAVYELGKDRRGYLVPARGSVETLVVKALEDAELIMVHVAV